MGVTPPSSGQPVPISGGTLLVRAGGHTAAASDPDHDCVWFVDLDGHAVTGNVLLQTGDEPGRLVEDAAGRVHVVLRRGGALVSIDPSANTVTRRAVCAAPRGLAYDAVLDAIHVACAEGSLVTLPAAGGAATRAVQLDGDLRDVVLQYGHLYVSRFRAAEILDVASDGTIAQRYGLPPTPNAQAAVAYRMVPVPMGYLAILHQRGQAATAPPVSTMPGGYGAGGTCLGSGVVQASITPLTPGSTPPVTPPLTGVAVGVDLAVSSDGTMAAVAVASGQPPGVYATPLTPMSACPTGSPISLPTPGQAVAVGFDWQNRLVVQTRAPGSIIFNEYMTIPLPGSDTSNDGLDVFYTGTKGGIACASCHPEAGDDGRVWQFANIGLRRTQNLRGGVMARTPFHWSGDIPDMNNLVSVVFESRMLGPTLSAPQIVALGQWLDAQPAIAAPPPADPMAVARGQMTFDDPSVGCAGCHNGPQLSNHQLVDVGTGGMFKVPSLVAVRYRAPYLHDGCAATLTDRFTPTCGGGDQHGHTSQLDAGHISDLVAYLESL
jgi:hypothetical protein